MKWFREQTLNTIKLKKYLGMKQFENSSTQQNKMKFLPLLFLVIASGIFCLD